MKRGRAVVVAAAVGLTLVVAGRAVAVARSADQAEREKRSAEAASAGAEAARRNAQREVEDFSQRIAQDRAALDDAQATAAERQAAKDRIDAEVAQLGARLTELQLALELGQTLTEAQQQRRQVLADCLLTVTLAQGLFTQGRSDEAVSVLRDGAVGCHRAQAVLDDADTGSDYAYDFPDPFVLVDGAEAYAYGTNGTGGAVQVLTGNGFGGWQLAGSALARVPAWAEPGLTWAPSVLRVGSGYLLYVTVRDRASGHQCITVAAATRPSGPFDDGTLWPLVCQHDLGGSIDASPYRAPDGSLHLVWKSEGETVGDRARIWTQRLAADGRSLTGAPTMLIEADRPWEDRIVEGPSMATIDGRIVLLYSANRWDTIGYAVGQALCDGPEGPCRKVDGPVVRTDGPFVGPGGAELFADTGGRWRIAFHSWAPNAVGNASPRRLHVEAVALDAAGRVSIT